MNVVELVKPLVLLIVNNGARHAVCFDHHYRWSCREEHAALRVHRDAGARMSGEISRRMKDHHYEK